MTESLHARCDSTYDDIIHFGVNQMSNTNRNRKETAEEIDGGETSDLAAAIPDSFGVTDASQANWLVRKIKELRAYKTRVKHWAATELRTARRDEDFLLGRFGAQLESWLVQQLHRERGRRSIKLPAGTVGLRAQPLRVLVEDEQALIEWCKTHLTEALWISVEVSGENAAALQSWLDEHFIEAKVTTGVLKSVVNSNLATSGELPAGASLIRARDAIHIK